MPVAAARAGKPMLSQEDIEREFIRAGIIGSRLAQIRLAVNDTQQPLALCRIKTDRGPELLSLPVWETRRDWFREQCGTILVVLYPDDVCH